MQKLSDLSLGDTFRRIINGKVSKEFYIVTEQGGVIPVYNGFINVINLSNGCLSRLSDQEVNQVGLFDKHLRTIHSLSNT